MKHQSYDHHNGRQDWCFYKMLATTKHFCKMLELAFDKNSLNMYNKNHKE